MNVERVPSSLPVRSPQLANVAADLVDASLNSLEPVVCLVDSTVRVVDPRVRVRELDVHAAEHESDHQPEDRDDSHGASDDRRHDGGCGACLDHALLPYHAVPLGPLAVGISRRRLGETSFRAARGRRPSVVHPCVCGATACLDLSTRLVHPRLSGIDSPNVGRVDPPGSPCVWWDSCLSIPTTAGLTCRVRSAVASIAVRLPGGRVYCLFESLLFPDPSDWLGRPRSFLSFTVRPLRSHLLPFPTPGALLEILAQRVFEVSSQPRRLGFHLGARQPRQRRAAG